MIHTKKIQYLGQNSKMRQSSYHYEIWNWGIPAFLSQKGTKTCPKAGHCITGCYAKSGTYNFPVVANKYEQRLELAQSEAFAETLFNEIQLAQNKAEKNGKECVIRIHDSGDFFSEEYAQAWLKVIRAHCDIKFYAYTKMVKYFKSLDNMPQNLTIIYSYGGLEDAYINPKRDRHSKVFETEALLIEAGYADASKDDTVAFGDNLKIGLIFHSNKKYANTNWHKVS